MGPKPVAKKAAPAKEAPPAKAKAAAKPAPAKPTASKAATGDTKKKKAKKDDGDAEGGSSALTAGRAQLDAGLAAGRAQLDAGMAVFGSAANNASEAFQGIWGGFSWPGAATGGPPAASANEKKKADPASAPVKPAAPVKKAIPESPAPDTSKPVATSSSSGGFFGFMGSKGSKEPGTIDISKPRERAPGKPPVTSAEDLRKENQKITEEKDISSLVARRDNVVNFKPGQRIMEFNDLRPLPVRIHPSVAPRQDGDDPRNTAILSHIVSDPLLVTKNSGVDKVMQSRQFIDAMKRSVRSSRMRIDDLSLSSSRYVQPVEPDRPISPMHDNISTVAFLPSPSSLCETCGLYVNACICETVKRMTRMQPPNRNILDRLLARMPGQDREDPDDEGTTTHSIKSVKVTSISERMRG